MRDMEFAHSGIGPGPTSRPGSTWRRLRPPRVVHVVGCVTDEVFSFLGPATAVLARSGVEQVVVMIDEPRFRHHLAPLREAAKLVLTPSVGNPLRQWRAVARACRKTLAKGGVKAVHLHGLMPCLAGAWAARAEGIRAPVFYSPHGSRSMGKLRALGQVALWVARPLLRRSPRGAIVNRAIETLAFDHWSSVDLIESPVGAAFLSATRGEARHPLIVTGGRVHNMRSAELFSQLAVLLGGEDLRISFNWIGTVAPASRVRLNAANVGVFDVAGDAECASRLAAGWVYLAPDSPRGFPLFLVEAMAVGLPCVALDCAAHRDVIRDGETGFLCLSERDMVERIATLIDEPALRARIGQAARLEAKQRYAESDFSAKLLAAYALPDRLAGVASPDLANTVEQSNPSPGAMT